MAGETYKILDLDIDYSKLITSTTQMKQKVAEMKAELDALKKSGKENTEEFVKLDTEMRGQQNLLRVNTKLLTDLTQAGEGQKLTIDQMRKALSVVSIQWAQLTEEERENSEEGKALTETKTKLTAELKRLEAATGDNRRNVGNYTQSILEAAKNSDVFGGVLGKMIGGLENFKGGLEKARDGFKAASDGTVGFQGGLRGIGGAMAASGIGTFVVIFGLIVDLMKNYKPVADAVERVTASLAAVMQEITNRLGKFMEGLKAIVTLDFAEGMDKMSESVDNLGGSLANAAVKAAELKQAQQDLEDMQVYFSIATAKAEQQVEQLLLKSKNRTLSEQQRLELLQKAAKIEQENYETTLGIANEAARIAREELMLKSGLSAAQVDEIENNKNNIAVLAKYTKALDNAGDAVRDNFIKAITEQIEVQRQSISVQEKITNRQDQLEQAAEEKRKKAADAAEAAAQKKEEARKKAQEATIKAMQEELELYDAMMGKEVASDSELVKRYQQRADILQKQREFGLLSETKYTTEVAKLQQEFQDEQLERSRELMQQQIAIAEEELALYVAQNQSRIDAGEYLTAELVQQEIDRLDKIEEVRVAILQQQFDAGLISNTEYLTMLLDLEREHEEAKLQLKSDYKVQEQERMQMDDANRMEIRALQNENDYILQQEHLNRMRDAEIATAEKTGADIALITQKYNLMQLKLQQEVNKKRLQDVSSLLGNVAELVGKNTAAGKAAAIAQAGINTYLGVTEVLAAKSTLPSPAREIYQGISIAATIANGLFAVAKIASVKAERGGKFGTVGGNTHAFGGTKYYGDDGNVIEMERDENFYVLNRGASRAINSLSSLNEYYGGVSFTGSSARRYLADGGMAARNMEIPDISGQIAEGVAEGIRSYRPVVDVKDVIDGVNQRVDLVDGASI